MRSTSGECGDHLHLEASCSIGANISWSNPKAYLPGSPQGYAQLQESLHSMKPKAMVSALGNYSSLIVPSSLHVIFSEIIFTIAVSPSNRVVAISFPGNRPGNQRSNSHAEGEKVLLLLCTQTQTICFLLYLGFFGPAVLRLFHFCKNLNVYLNKPGNMPGQITY